MQDVAQNHIKSAEKLKHFPKTKELVGFGEQEVNHLPKSILLDAFMVSLSKATYMQHAALNAFSTRVQNLPLAGL